MQPKRPSQDKELAMQLTFRNRVAGLLWLVVLACCTTSTAVAGLRVPFSDRDDGISCSYYDVGLGVPWQARGAGWLDAEDKPQGTRAHAAFQAEASDQRRVHRADVSALVKGWWSGRWPNHGLLLRAVNDSGVSYHARESNDAALRPQLILQWRGGRRLFVEPAADATLDCSTYRGVGRTPTLTLNTDKAVAIRFDLAAVQQGMPAPETAELVLVRPAGETPSRVGWQIFRLSPPVSGTASPERGLARNYPGDRGIAADPWVMFAEAFESRKPDSRWVNNQDAPGEIVDEDRQMGFAPLVGRALKVTIPKGGLLGLDMRLRLQDKQGSEPEEVYFRYYLRLARDWLGAKDGGKLPGLAGTYGKAGWGGRPWDGSKGWSLRGSFGTTPPTGHRAAGSIMLGTYAYHFKSSTYGEGMVWSDGDFAGLIEPDRWYCIEQHLKLNTAGQEDGVLQVWVNDQLALSRTNLRLRDLPTIRIQEVWMNFYHGGTQPAPLAMHAYVDNVVVARRRIGSMQP